MSELTKKEIRNLLIENLVGIEKKAQEAQEYYELSPDELARYLGINQQRPVPVRTEDHIDPMLLQALMSSGVENSGSQEYSQPPEDFNAFLEAILNSTIS